MFALFALIILLSTGPWNVASFGWVKLDSLSERLMGARPEWVVANNLNSNHNPHYPRSVHSSTQTCRGRSCSQLQSTTAPNNKHRQREPQSTTKQDQASMLEFMNEQPNLLDRADLDPLAPLDVDTMDLLHCIIRAADGRKADDIVALKVHHVSTLTSVLVILSGNSRPQNQAIAAAITKDVQEQFQGQRPGGNGIPEGSAESGWMLLDYGTVMVHIMTPRSRLFYNVQGQWMQKGAKEIDISHILIPNAGNKNVPPPISPRTWTTHSSSLSSKPPMLEKDEEDPFWS